MKLIVILLTVACLQVSAEGFSQQITLSKNSVSLKSVLQEIRKQSGYQLLYNTDLIQKAKPVSINVRNSGLEDALKQSLKGQDFTYEITDKTILIMPVASTNPNNLRWEALKQIRGKVSMSNGQPLPGVVVTEKGTSNKTATNGDGVFELRNAADDAVLVFSYIGFQQQEIATKGATGPLNITMIESDNKLQEVNVVVSTGYQNIPKERATGSFSFVDQSKLGITNLGGTDFAKGLEGLVPGLLVAPDGTMQIRGVSSIRQATRAVLIVVDGFPVESGNFTINPNDIENITVLKDAAAASIWGARASNGVVVIKTKSGMATQGKAVFNFTSNLSISETPDFSYLRLPSSAEYIDAEAESFRRNWVNFANADNNAYSLVGGLFYKKYLSDRGGQPFTEAQLASGLNQLGQYNVLNEQDLFYRKAIQRQLNLSVRGGTEKYNFAISTLYTKQLTNLVGNDNDNLVLNFKNSLQVLPKVVLSLGINTTYGKNSGGNIGYDYNFAKPYTRILDENGNYVSRTSRVSDHMKQGYYDKGYLSWDDNALQNMQNTTTETKTFASRINVGADYSIIKGLNFSSQFQTELRNVNKDNLQNINTYNVRFLANTWRVFDAARNVYVNKFPIGPLYDKGKENQNSWTFRNVFNLDRQFGSDHAVNAIAGMEVRRIGLKSNSERYYNYNPQSLTVDNIDLAALAISQPTSLGTNSSYTWNPAFVERENRFFSIFANAAYTYKNRYTVSGSVRTDQSNLFGTDPEYRYRPLWSSGLSWNMTNEDFMSSVNFLDKLIFRVTYGVNGNIGNSSPYPIAGTGKNFNTQENMLTFNNPENQALRPEKTTSTNFGVDFAIFKHRISGSFDVYGKKSYDLLSNSILDPTTGFVSSEKNTASMKNRGVELNLNARILQGEVRLDADFNFGYNKNKVTNVLTPTINAATYVTGSTQIVDLPISYMYSYKWAGLSALGEPQIYDAAGNVKSWSTSRLTDINALEYVGTLDPPVYGGMMLNLGYKGFTLSPQFTFKMGHVMRQNITRTELSVGVTSDIANRWKATGDETKTNIPRLFNTSSIDAKWNDYYRNANIWNDDASFIRLRSLTLSYQMPKKFLFNVFTAASLTAQANNVWLWTANKQGLDPDYIDLRTGSIGTPPVKNYVFSLNLNF